MKKNSIALLEDSYISPLLLNTLIREGVPAHAKSNRLKMELGRYYPDLIILNENEATNILTKPESLVYANSDLSLSTMMDSLNGPLEMDVIGSHKDKSDAKHLSMKPQWIQIFAALRPRGYMAKISLAMPISMSMDSPWFSAFMSIPFWTKTISET